MNPVKELITKTNWLETRIVNLETQEGSGGGVTDHGALDGLADDDHTQYLLADGSRIVSGDLTVSDAIRVGKGLSLGDISPPFEVRGTLFLDHTGSGSYGFISSQNNLHMYQNQYYNGSAWKAIGTGKVGGIQTSMGSDIPFMVVSSQASYVAEDNVVTYTNFRVTNASVLEIYQSGTGTRGANIYVDANWFRLNADGARNIYVPSTLRADGGLSATNQVSDPGDGQMAAQMYRLYEGATEVGRFEAQDTTWTRFNQSLTKNIYTPRTFSAAVSLTAGGSIQPGTGWVSYTAGLRPYKNTTLYTCYGYYPHTAYWSSTSWDGDAKGATGGTKIDLSAVFGLPPYVKGVYVRLIAKRSGAVSDAYYFGVGPSATYDSNVVVYTHSNVYRNGFGIAACDGNGDIYYTIATSGTTYCYLRIYGYFI